MPSWYGVLKVLHVVAVVLWIGGAAALIIVTQRLLRARDRAALASLVPQASKYGHSVGAPSAMLVLITGIAMVVIGGIGFRPLWVSWGFVGILLHFLVGMFVMRKRSMALAAALAANPADDARIAAAGRSLRVGSTIYLLIMTSVIVVMVLKPTL